MEYMGQKQGTPITDIERTDEQEASIPEADARECGTDSDSPIREEKEEKQEIRKRFGSGEVVIDSVQLIGEDGNAKDLFKTGERIKISVSYHTKKEITDAMIGFGIFRVDGVHVAGTNTYIDHLGDVTLRQAGTIICDISRINLVSGEYTLDFAIHSTSSHVYDDWKEVQKIRIYSDTYDIGIVHIEHAWEIA